MMQAGIEMEIVLAAADGVDPPLRLHAADVIDPIRQGRQRLPAVGGGIVDLMDVDRIASRPPTAWILPLSATAEIAPRGDDRGRMRCH